MPNDVQTSVHHHEDGSPLDYTDAELLVLARARRALDAVVRMETVKRRDPSTPLSLLCNGVSELIYDQAAAEVWLGDLDYATEERLDAEEDAIENLGPFAIPKREALGHVEDDLDVIADDDLPTIYDQAAVLEALLEDFISAHSDAGAPRH